MKIEREVETALREGQQCLVTAVEGPDEVCEQCTNLIGDRCASPNGDEATVKKWDSILARDLGIAPGTSMSAAEWRSLVRSRTPFKICARCRWITVCSIGKQQA